MGVIQPPPPSKKHGFVEVAEIQTLFSPIFGKKCGIPPPTPEGWSSGGDSALFFENRRKQGLDFCYLYKTVFFRGGGGCITPHSRVRQNACKNMGACLMAFPTLIISVGGITTHPEKPKLLDHNICRVAAKLIGCLGCCGYWEYFRPPPPPEFYPVMPPFFPQVFPPIPPGRAFGKSLSLEQML